MRLAVTGGGGDGGGNDFDDGYRAPDRPTRGNHPMSRDREEEDDEPEFGRDRRQRNRRFSDARGGDPWSPDDTSHRPDSSSGPSDSGPSGWAGSIAHTFDRAREKKDQVVEETKQKVDDVKEDVEEDAEKQTKSAQDTASSAVEDTKGAVEDVQQEVEERVEETKDTVTRTKRDIEQEVERRTQQTKDTVDRTADDVTGEAEQAIDEVSEFIGDTTTEAKTAVDRGAGRAERAVDDNVHFVPDPENEGQVRVVIGGDAPEDEISAGEAFQREYLSPDTEITDRLTDTRGLVGDEREQALQERAEEDRDRWAAGDQARDVVTAHVPDDLVVAGVDADEAAGDIAAGVGDIPGDVAALDENVVLLADTGTEAVQQYQRTADEHGHVATWQAAGETAATAGAGMAREARERPFYFLGNVGGEVLLGTAGFKAVEKGAGAARSARVAAKSDRPAVDLEDITDETGAKGGLPKYDTDPGAPTRQAVDEVEAKARDNPDEMKPGGSEGAIYHTTMDDGIRGDLEVGEGASELPGLWGSPEASGIGLNVRGARSRLSDLKPRTPRLRGDSDQVVSLPGDDVRGMPDRAQGAAYELRTPDGDVVERGLGRGQAKARAKGTGLEVRPDSSTRGYEFLTEGAEEGAAYVRPTGSRTTELEAIFRPGSEFVEEGVTPVRIGGRDIPGTDVRIPGTGRLVPGRRFVEARDADAPSGRKGPGRGRGDDPDGGTGRRDADPDSDTGPRGSPDADLVTGYELPSSRVTRRQGQPYAPPAAPSVGGPSGRDTSPSGRSSGGGDPTSGDLSWGDPSRPAGGSGPDGSTSRTPGEPTRGPGSATRTTSETPSGTPTGTPTTGTPTGTPTGPPSVTPTIGTPTSGTPTGDSSTSTSGGSGGGGSGGGGGGGGPGTPPGPLSRGFGFDSESEPRKKRRAKAPAEEEGAGDDDPLAVGYLVETYAGFAGLGVAGGGGLAVDQGDLEAQEGSQPFGEYMPAWEGQGAIEFGSTLDWFGLEEGEAGGDEIGWL